MAGRPEKDPTAPVAHYERHPHAAAVEAIAPTSLIESWRKEPVCNAPGTLLTELEEQVLIEHRRGKSAKWIEAHLGYSRHKVRQLVQTDRGQAFLQTLSREFAALKASRLAEAALGATNFLDEIVNAQPDFMGDEAFASLPIDERMALIMEHQKIRVRAAAELLRADTKTGPSVSVSVNANANPVVDELLKRLRGEPRTVDIKLASQEEASDTHVPLGEEGSAP